LGSRAEMVCVRTQKEKYKQLKGTEITEWVVFENDEIFDRLPESKTRPDVPQ
jgi:hypothetical protein